MQRDKWVVEVPEAGLVCEQRVFVMVLFSGLACGSYNPCQCKNLLGGRIYIYNCLCWRKIRRTIVYSLWSLKSLTLFLTFKCICIECRVHHMPSIIIVFISKSHRNITWKMKSKLKFSWFTSVWPSVRLHVYSQGL